MNSGTPTGGVVRRWLGWLSRRLERFRRREDEFSLILSLVIGAVVGLVVVAFILLTGRLATQMYPPGGSGWRRILVPVTGSLATGWLLWRYFPFARGSGIPQTKFALFIQDGKILLRTVLGKFICCSASLASGISLGREGPSVQIGGGIASVVARNLGLGTGQVRSLVPAGCAAALAAAFNTPIAAVLFSLEEIMGDLHASVLGSVVLSSATSWVMLHLILGDEPLFHVAAYQLVNPAELGVYAILGVVGGLGSVAFVKLLLGLRAWFLALPAWTVWFQPVAGGLTIGIMGYFLPDIMGVGYNQIEKVLNGDIILKTVVLLAILKIVATAVCYSSGNAGGIFGPSLFIGAMMGAAVGGVAHSLFPASTAGAGAYALVGMGTAFAGIVRTPFTSVIMIFEMTRDYTIIVPLMISNAIAFFISHKLQAQPIYEALSGQMGIHLPGPESHSARGMVQVHQIIRSAPAGFEMNADDERGTRSNTEEFPHLHPDHTLAVALDRMAAAGMKTLPVVSRADIRKLLGVVVFEDVLAAYGTREAENSQESRAE